MKLLARGKLDTLLLCLALGAWQAIVGYCTDMLLFLTVPVLRRMADWQVPYTLSRMPFGVLKGIVWGAAWALLVVPLLRRKPLDRIMWPLATIVTLVAIVRPPVGIFQLLGGSIEPHVLQWLPTLAFACACIYLRRTIPELPASICDSCGQRLDRRGVCASCGDASLWERRAAQWRALGLMGMSVTLALVVLFVATRDGSFGHAWRDRSLAIGRAHWCS